VNRAGWLVSLAVVAAAAVLLATDLVPAPKSRVIDLVRVAPPGPEDGPPPVEEFERAARAVADADAAFAGTDDALAEIGRELDALLAAARADGPSDELRARRGAAARDLALRRMMLDVPASLPEELAALAGEYEGEDAERARAALERHDAAAPDPPDVADRLAELERKLAELARLLE